MCVSPAPGWGRVNVGKSGLEEDQDQRQPLPQQPHQGRSRVRAMLLASFFSLFVLFVLFDRLRELRFSDPSGSSPDSVTESSFDPLSLLDLLELE